MIWLIIGALVLLVLFGQWKGSVLIRFFEKCCPPIAKLLSGIGRMWMKFSHALGFIVTTLILTILWIIGFGVYAVILRIVSIPKLFAKAQASYWIDVKAEDHDSMKYPF